MKILFNLVSAQTAPNYIAIKEINPDKIIYLNTNATKNHSNWLKSAINIDSEIYLIDAYDYLNIYENVKSLVLKYKSGDENELILNFTGGTKIMSFASLNVFNEFNLDSVYIDSENNKILYFPVNNEFNQTDINCKILIKDYFKIYGHNMDVAKFKDYDRNFSTKQDLKIFLIKNAENYRLLLSGYANKNNSKNYFCKDKEFSEKESSIIWNSAEKKLVVKFQTSGISTKFEMLGNGRINSNYLTGGWFEEVCFEKLKSSNIFDEILRNIEFPDNKDKNIKKNELDIVAIKNNTLYIFECKSGLMKQDFIYKLKSIKENYGGTYAKILFLSYLSVNDANNLEKITEYGIKLILFNELDDFINTFINSVTDKNINL